MKKLSILLFSTVFILFCQHNANDRHIETAEKVEVSKNKPTWNIFGNEPFWGMYIHADTVLYARVNEKIDSIYLIIHHFSDRDSILEMHVMDAAMNEGTIVIRKESCSDGMSDKQYAYSAQFSYRNEVLKGCAVMK